MSDRQEVLNLIAEGIGDRMDIDTGASQWAEGALDALTAAGYVVTREPEEPELNLATVWQAYEWLQDGTGRGKFAYRLTRAEVEYLNKLSDSSVGPLYQSQWEPEAAVALAQTISESIHQSFDGWSDQEKAVIQMYLADLAIAFKG